MYNRHCRLEDKLAPYYSHYANIVPPLPRLKKVNVLSCLQALTFYSSLINMYLHLLIFYGMTKYVKKYSATYFKTSAKR